MKLKNKDLKKIYMNAFINRKKRMERCPSFKLLLKTARMEISEKRRNDIIDHISRCPFCAEEIKFVLNLRSFESELEDVILKLSVFSNHVKSKKYETFTSAIIKKNRAFKYAIGILGLVIVVLCTWKYLSIPKNLNFRGNRIQYIKIVEPKGRINLSDAILVKWESNIKANHFICEIFDENLILIWKSQRISCCEYILPNFFCDPEIKRRRTYFCMISAYSHDDVEIESCLTKFKCF